MGLREAVESVMNQMDGEASIRHGEASAVLEKYVGMLRLIFQASKGEFGQGRSQVSAEMQHSVEIQKAKEEFKRGKIVPQEGEWGQFQEAEGPRMAELSGGPGTEEGLTIIRVPRDVSLGEEVFVGKHLYVYGEDGRLHYKPPQLGVSHVNFATDAAEQK